MNEEQRQAIGEALTDYFSEWEIEGWDCHDSRNMDDLIDRAIVPHIAGRVVPRFPAMLRKMWSGGEVQAWLDANVGALIPDADPVTTVLTFAQFVQYGIEHGANVVNGMPWSFTFHGHAVTHENDDLYLLCATGLRFARGELLIATVFNGSATLQVIPTPAQKLSARAQVGNTRFGVGIDWRTVIEAAQRHHAYMFTPEKEAARMRAAQAAIAGLQGSTATQDEAAYADYSGRPDQGHEDGFERDESALHHAYFAGIAHGRTTAPAPRVVPVELPARVFDVLYMAAGVSSYHPRGDQREKLHAFGRAVVAEAFARFPYEEPHPDSQAVDAFAEAMKNKMALSRSNGRGGWETCPPADLSRMLREHVDKGDPVDVANFAMMLHQLGASIADPWMPIETAPRDGQTIMLRFGSDVVTQGRYVNYYPHFPWAFIDRSDNGRWFTNHARNGDGGPSHWKRVP